MPKWRHRPRPIVWFVLQWSALPKTGRRRSRPSPAIVRRRRIRRPSRRLWCLTPARLVLPDSRRTGHLRPTGARRCPRTRPRNRRQSRSRSGESTGTYLVMLRIVSFRLHRTAFATDGVLQIQPQHRLRHPCIIAKQAAPLKTCLPGRLLRGTDRLVHLRRMGSLARTPATGSASPSAPSYHGPAPTGSPMGLHPPCYRPHSNIDTGSATQLSSALSTEPYTGV